MPVRISEGIEETKKRLDAELEIQRRYPDAYLEDIDGTMCWVSEKAKTDCTNIIAVVRPDGANRTPEAWLYPFLVVEGMRVYVARPHRRPFWAVVDTLAEKSPDTLKTLINATMDVGFAGVIG